MLLTPKLDHITTADYENVYEPAEDTFLFMDALEKDANLIKEQVKPSICLEIGSGSGCISTFLGQLLGDSSKSLILCTDINPYASQITLKTGKSNMIQLDPILTDLTSGLLPRLRHSVDILCFNPPYVVTPSEEVNSSNLIEKAWAGGVDGREVIDRTLPLVDELLSARGVFYLLVISENKPDDIRIIMQERYKFQSEVVLSRLSGREKEIILKFRR
ncbi:11109_t:CDS:2 [Ambispora gerdemannii]|uniref:11109_t:CDS:1 n=1 Tax=Ambispora gerdemannii TaxID=144530 RepID=A0A9N9BL10_9GLOM|nr:11109_t:CDS:2 [Ambispora gerdemannii]